jgi:putative transposase
MDRTHIQVYVHLLFTARLKEVPPLVQNEFHQYISRVCKNLKCRPVAVGGISDHVHILCGLDENISLKVLAEEIKLSSSRWLKAQRKDLIDFAWQKEFYCASETLSDLQRLKHYIENQKEHHLNLSIEEELRRMITGHELQIDAPNFWQ